MKKIYVFFCLCFILQLPDLAADNKQNAIWLVTAEIENIGRIKFYTLAEIKDTSLILRTIEDRDKFILGNGKAKLLRMFEKRKTKALLQCWKLLKMEKSIF